MLSSLKTLAVVLFVSFFVFRFAEPICLEFMRREDFARRRRVWFSLTITAFLSPSFWIYALIAAPLLVWSARADRNPVSLYLMMYYIIPPSSIYIPVVGINQLFDLNQIRILSFTVLLPTAWRLLNSPDSSVKIKFTLMDAFILSYSGLCLAQSVPFESPTNTMRRAFILFLDDVLVYFVLSRVASNRKSIVDSMASFCLACAIFSPLAIFESAKAWLLYQGIWERWGVPDQFAYLMRGESLRAQVSTGHSLNLGCTLAIGFGFWLYLKSRVPSIFLGLLGIGWMWAGMIAAYSRSPWITAVMMFFVFKLLNTNGFSKFMKSLVWASLILGVVLMSPLGNKILDNLPFIGTVDEANVTYRQELARLSWSLVQQNPFFGDVFVLRNMESLRQGQGIIDLVNGYASVALFHGLVGLFLFCGFFLVGVTRSWARVKQWRSIDPDLSLIGASLLACMLAILFFIGTAGLFSLIYPLAGLLASYSNIVSSWTSKGTQYNEVIGMQSSLSDSSESRRHRTPFKSPIP